MNVDDADLVALTGMFDIDFDFDFDIDLDFEGLNERLVETDLEGVVVDVTALFDFDFDGLNERVTDADLEGVAVGVTFCDNNVVIDVVLIVIFVLQGI
jgi:hypothetical protein